MLAGLLALLLVLLCIPWRAAGRVQNLALNESGGAHWEATSWRVEADWAFGLVTFVSVKEPGRPAQTSLRLAGFTKALSAGGARRGGRPRPPRPKPSRRRRRGLTLPEFLALLPELRPVMARLWRSLGLEAQGKLTYGLEDPYLTGVCEGLRAMLPWPRDLRLTPDFGEAKLEGWARVRMRVVPIRPAAVLVAVLLRREIRRVWWPRLKARLAGTA